MLVELNNLHLHNVVIVVTPWCQSDECVQLLLIIVE